MQIICRPSVRLSGSDGQQLLMLNSDLYSQNSPQSDLVSLLFAITYLSLEIFNVASIHMSRSSIEQF
jgi:hypothetical protein